MSSKFLSYIILLSRRYPIELTLLLALALPILFYGLGDYSIVNGDEAFYHYAARRMVETGEWSTIQFNREIRPYDTFLNAPLHYWLKALIIIILGDSLWTMRILSAFFGFLCIFIVYYFTSSFFDRLTAFLASLILLTTWQFIYWHSARTGEMETIISFFLFLALFLFIKGLNNTKLLILHHCCLAIIMNLKLPFVIVPILAEIAFFLLHPRYRNVAVKCLLYSLVILPFGLSWHFFQAIYQSADILNAASLMLARVTGDRQDFNFLLSCRKNISFYLSTLLFGAFPYSVLFPAAILFTRQKRESNSAVAVRLLIIYIFTILLFYTAIRQHLYWYIIPIYPLISILLGLLIKKMLYDQLNRIQLTVSLFLLTLVYCFKIKVISLNPFSAPAVWLPHDIRLMDFTQLNSIAVLALLTTFFALLSQAMSKSKYHNITRSLVLTILTVLFGLGILRSVSPLIYIPYESELEAKYRNTMQLADEQQELPISIRVTTKYNLSLRYYFGDHYKIRKLDDKGTSEYLLLRIDEADDTWQGQSPLIPPGEPIPD